MILTRDEVEATQHCDYCRCGCRATDSVLADSHEELRAERDAALAQIAFLERQLGAYLADV